MLFNANVCIFGLCRDECPTLDSAARRERQSRTVSPKKTTALSRTQTVCIILLRSSSSTLLFILLLLLCVSDYGVLILLFDLIGPNEEGSGMVSYAR